MLASPPCVWTPVPLADPGPSAGGAGAGEGDDEELEDEEVEGEVVDVVGGVVVDGGVVEEAPPAPISLASSASDGSLAAAG